MTDFVVLYKRLTNLSPIRELLPIMLLRSVLGSRLKKVLILIHFIYTLDIRSKKTLIFIRFIYIMAYTKSSTLLFFLTIIFSIQILLLALLFLEGLAIYYFSIIFLWNQPLAFGSPVCSQRNSGNGGSITRSVTFLPSVTIGLLIIST